jgi:hypothetical protein
MSVVTQGDGLWNNREPFMVILCFDADRKLPPGKGGGFVIFPGKRCHFIEY